MTLQGFGLLFHNMLARIVELAGNSENAVKALRTPKGDDPNSTEAFAEHRAKKD